MAIILDTDVIIRGEKGTFDLRDSLTLHASEEIEIAAITLCGQQRFWLLMRGEQRFEALAQRHVAFAHHVEKCGVLCGWFGGRQLEQQFVGGPVTTTRAPCSEYPLHDPNHGSGLQ